MKFTVQRASDYWDDNKTEQVTINTIEELQKVPIEKLTIGQLHSNIWKA